MSNISKKAKPNNGKTVLQPCRCLSEFQDSRYGRSVRVHNEGSRKLTCTVCGTEKVRPVDTPARNE